MTEQHERLRAAREAAGYASAADAAAAMGVKGPTYTHHENGTRGLTRRATAERYSRFFRVHLEWLLTGRGPMKARERAYADIPVDGVVGAGARVVLLDDAADSALPTEVTLPSDGTLGALIVEGDSQYPVFTEGEVVLYDRRPLQPSELIGRLAVVQLMDGARLLKTVQAGRGRDVFKLQSFNGRLEDDVKLLAAYRYIGALERP